MDGESSEIDLVWVLGFSRIYLPRLSVVSTTSILPLPLSLAQAYVHHLDHFSGRNSIEVDDKR